MGEFRSKVNYLAHDLFHGTWFTGEVINRLSKMEQTNEIKDCIRLLEKGKKQSNDIIDYFYKYAQTHPDWDKKEETK